MFHVLWLIQSLACLFLLDIFPLKKVTKIIFPQNIQGFISFLLLLCLLLRNSMTVWFPMIFFFFLSVCQLLYHILFITFFFIWYVCEWNIFSNCIFQSYAGCFLGFINLKKNVLYIWDLFCVNFPFFNLFFCFVFFNLLFGYCIACIDYVYLVSLVIHVCVFFCCSFIGEISIIHSNMCCAFKIFCYHVVSKLCFSF